MKCDALPYRTFYDQNRCYVINLKPLGVSEAAAECSRIFPGSSILFSPPSNLWNDLFLNSEKFHSTENSSGQKTTICYYESRRECPDGSESSDLPGAKCIVRGSHLMSHANAASFCESRSASLPSVSNGGELRALYGLLSNKAGWAQTSVSSAGWKNHLGLPLLNTCGTAAAANFCASTSFAQFVGQRGAPAQAQSGIEDAASLLQVICVRDATTSYNYLKGEEPTQPPATTQTTTVAATTRTSTKPTVVTTSETPCIPWKPCPHYHYYNSASKKCEWVGPDNACLILYNHLNQTMYHFINKWPGNRNSGELDMWRSKSLVNTFNDRITKVVVREGCRANLWAHSKGVNCDEKWKHVDNKPGGTYTVPCFLTKTLNRMADGATRVQCECDPAEARKFEPRKKPANADEVKTCPADQQYNYFTKKCEWGTGADNFCVKLINHLNQSRSLAIPNFPNNRNSGEWDLWRDKSTTNVYNDRTVKVVVRQGCFSTIWAHAKGVNCDEKWRLLDNVGAGPHKVPCFLNGGVKRMMDGATRIACHCPLPPFRAQSRPANACP